MKTKEEQIAEMLWHENFKLYDGSVYNMGLIRARLIANKIMALPLDVPSDEEIIRHIVTHCRDYENEPDTPLMDEQTYLEGYKAAIAEIIKRNGG
jgi:hypothetical protein